MKRTNTLYTAIVFLVLLTSCSSTKEPAGVWVNKEKIQGKSFEKIFIVVMTADIVARSVIEKDLADAALAKGFQVVKSTDVIPSSIKDPKLPEKEEVISKVKENGCDAIFVSTLLKNDDSIHYTPSRTTYAPSTHPTWSGEFFGYYSNYSTVVSNKSYYTVEKKYFMMSNLYDVATSEVMWSVQSKIFDPSSLNNFSKVYTGSLIMKLESSALLKNRQK